MIDIKVISRKEAESLKANELPSGAAIISFYDPISPRTPKDYHMTAQQPPKGKVLMLERWGDMSNQAILS